MLSQILGSLNGALAVIWSDIAVGVVLVAASLSFVMAVVLTVGRGRMRSEDDPVGKNLAR